MQRDVCRKCGEEKEAYARCWSLVCVPRVERECGNCGGVFLVQPTPRALDWCPPCVEEWEGALDADL